MRCVDVIIGSFDWTVRRGDVTGDTMARCPGGLPPEGRRPRRCPPFHSTKEGKIATRSRFSFVID